MPGAICTEEKWRSTPSAPSILVATCRFVCIWDRRDDYGFVAQGGRFRVVVEAQFPSDDESRFGITDTARVRFGSPTTSSEPTLASAVQVVRTCEEDELIVGQGEYTGGQGWDSYACEARDDL